ncbi:MAG: purine-binding chemotaxis protein CheW [Spirochaetales bacterium]|nr:purine-binding chemotaxis protein CheW [Leptospiraceae bacterium]MCP5480387.1 purine-binding chemotaxis protein CheW [Spirochaetales bacterium]
MAVRKANRRLTREEEIRQKYLTFLISEEEYGMPVSQVVEIIRVSELVRIPHAHDYFEGLMNFRGRPLPVLSLARRLGMEDSPEPAEGRRAIVIQIHGRRLGLVVDQVRQVVSFPPEQIDPGPPSLKGQSSRYVLGIGKGAGEFVVLMNLEALFGREEVAGLAADQ